MFDASILEYDGPVTYTTAIVGDGNATGYLAIGFVDAVDDRPPLELGTRERREWIECVRNYSRGELHGKTVYVLSHSRSHAINRLQRIAGRRLKPLPEETLLELSRGAQ